MSTSKKYFHDPLLIDKKKGGSLIAVKSLSKRYSDKKPEEGLQNLNFTIDKGKITAIIGESGSGKSTLLNLLFGLLQVDVGEILFKGIKIKGPQEKLIPGHEAMRLVSQHFNDLNTYAKVWDNVASGLSNTDLENKIKRTAKILEQLRITKLKDQRIVDLSGGEKQRVAIARALVTAPEVLLMDEPFNQIDASFRDQLQYDIRQVVDETGLTVVFVSHDPTEVMGLADQLIILKEGEISAIGDPRKLYQCPPNTYVARILTKSNILNPQEASLIGLPSQEKTIIIHPEWISLQADSLGIFSVQNVFYRGFYDEIVIESGNTRLRVYQLTGNILKKGQKVRPLITNFLAISN